MPKTVEGQALSLADRLDSLAAFFHVGIVPTGSEDPYALRRHATAIVRILLEGADEIRLDLRHVVQAGLEIVAGAGFKPASPKSGDTQKRLVDFLFERVRHYGRTVSGLRDDVMKAVLNDKLETVELRDLLERMKRLQAMTVKPEFDPLIIGFKRAHRLVEKEKGTWNPMPIDPQRFQHPSEGELHTAIEERRARMSEALQQMRGAQYGHAYDNAIDLLVELKPTIDAFFEAVMVNAEDTVVRSNRLSLLKEVDEFFMTFADFSQIVVQGG